jgi:hypothetical protein
MLWQDVLFDRPADSHALVPALAEAFGVEPSGVRVVDEITPELDTTGVAVLAERTPRRGHFPVQLSIYLRGPALAQRMTSFPATVQAAKRLAGLLQSGCLIAGDADNPEADFLIQPNGELLRVTLDDDALANDEYVVTASEPIGSATARNLR